MIKKGSILLIFGLFSCLSCKKKAENAFPVINVISPLDNSQINASNYLKVSATIKDDGIIQKVYLQLLTDKYAVVSEQKEHNFYVKEIEFNDSIYLDDKQITQAGNYILKVRVWDGELFTNEYVPISVGVRSSSNKNVFVVTKANQNKFYAFEAGSLTYKTSIGGTIYQAIAIDDKSIFSTTENPGSATLLNLNNGSQTIENTTSDCPSLNCWSSLCINNSKAYCYNNGNRNLYTVSNNVITHMLYSAVQYAVEEIAANDNYIAVEERSNASALPVNIRIINSNTGASVQNVSCSGDVIKMYWRVNELIVFSVKSNRLSIQKIDFVNAAPLVYTYRDISTSLVYVEKKNDNEFYLHYDGKLLLYSTSDNSIRTLQTIDINGMKHDAFYKRLFLFKGSSLYWFDDGSVVINELKCNEEIVSICSN